MNDMRAPYIGPQTKPIQERASRVSVEDVEHANARVQGTFVVAVPDSVWQKRPAFGDLETEIEEAIRSVLQKYVRS